MCFTLCYLFMSLALLPLLATYETGVCWTSFRRLWMGVYLMPCEGTCWRTSCWEWVNIAPDNLVACAECALICVRWTLLIRKALIKLYYVLTSTNTLSCFCTWALGKHAKQIACCVHIAWFCASLYMEVSRKLKLKVRSFVWGCWEVFCRLQNGRGKKKSELWIRKFRKGYNVSRYWLSCLM
jgi:hypothetical protein